MSYNRSSTVAHYTMHRGVVVSIIQAFFSITFYGVAIPVYNGLLMFGYTSFFNNVSLFSLFLDEDVTPEIACDYPALYKELLKGRLCSFKTFLIWTFISIYQGGVIMLGTICIFDLPFANMITITFSALIYVELCNIHTTLTKVNWLMIGAACFTIIIYIVTIEILPESFDKSYITWGVVLKVLAITAIAWLPLYILKKVE
jgi:phospholipid-translocating ATPase